MLMDPSSLLPAAGFVAHQHRLAFGLRPSAIGRSAVALCFRQRPGRYPLSWGGGGNVALPSHAAVADRTGSPEMQAGTHRTWAPLEAEHTGQPNSNNFSLGLEVWHAGHGGQCCVQEAV